MNYIYRITLLCGYLSGKYYLGKHTGFLTDGYAGSGRIVKDYFKKYGRKKNVTYIKEILEFNASIVINSEREREVIGDLWQTDPNCLNCCEGGCTGGLNIVPWNKGAKGCYSEKTIEKMRNAKLGTTPWNKGKHGIYSNETRTKIGDSARGRKDTTDTRRKKSEKLTGRPVSQQTREKISTAKKGRKWTIESRQKIMKPILQFTKDKILVKEWNGAREAGEQLGLSYKQIWKGLNGQRKYVGGFIWKYKEGA